ncbi:Polyprotein [Phytophthora palmivora]|uniref:Polyprotein n=1 Tax=Phytophthora palmivora TaxID=4796 RepID=A0A2P4Y732_9STRA|nr:Polyprotein [Phytophthora palmivora]
MNYAFDCILGIPWLTRYQPQIDWLARSVKRPLDFDVSEVFTHLMVAPRDWPHVKVVDERASNGPLCTTCAALLTGEDDEGRAREDARERQASAHPCSSRMKNVAVEQRLPHDIEAVEQWLPHDNEAVEQRFPHDNEAVEQRFPHVNEAVDQRLPHVNAVVMQRLSHATEAVEQRLPHDDTAVGPPIPPRATGAAEDELSRLEEGVSSSSESDTSVSSSGTRRTKTFRRSRRRLKPRRNFADPPPGRTESVCIIEYADGAPRTTRVIEVANPPDYVKSITRLPGLSWKKYLRDLKAGDIEQVYLFTDADSVPHEINSVELDDASSRPKSVEAKSAREERFAAQSWVTLKASASGINLTSVSPEMDLRNETVAAYTDDEVYANILAGAHDPETLYAVTRSKAKQALATPISANYAPKSPTRQVDNAAVSAFFQRRASIARFVRDTLQDAVDKQKENADKRGRKNMDTFWRRESPAPESAPVTPDSTGSPLQGPSGSPRSAQSPPQLPSERPVHDSLQSPHPLEYPGVSPIPANPLRRLLTRLAKSAGPWITSWRTRTLLMRCLVPVLVRVERPPAGSPPARRYQVRWVGYPPDEDTWEPRSSLLRDVPDAVLEYENEIVNENAAVGDHAAASTANRNH